MPIILKNTIEYDGTKIPAGTKGTIVYIHEFIDSLPAFEVEFYKPDKPEKTIITLLDSDFVTE